MPNQNIQANCPETAIPDTAIKAENPYMAAAIQEALKGITSGHGGLSAA